MNKSLFRYAASALLLTALGCLWCASAFGHAFPDRCDPKVGATVQGSPARVRIWFDGELEPAFSRMMVHNAAGMMVDKGDGRVDPSDGTLLEISLPVLPPGQYRVMWSAVSRDGHATSGDYSFTVK